jgi:GDPmannose 4,6-dehydratase
MSKCALITGVNGQDGSYLAEYLVELGYSVLGHSRRIGNHQYAMALPINRINHSLETKQEWLETIDRYEVSEIYHLAGVTFIPDSWNAPQATFAANLSRTLELLEALRIASNPPKLFFASSSEVFGSPFRTPLNESTLFRPTNPYGISKLACMGLIECYRSRFGLFACSGILFNHESPRRDPSFVTRKITRSVARIKFGLQERLVLGNLDAVRDWGYAVDYVDCMHRMLEADIASDYVIGTGKATSLREFVEVAFRSVGLDWKDWVDLSPEFARTDDGKVLIADSRKAEIELGWSAKTTVNQLVQIMVDSDLQKLRNSSLRAA